jgi:hypothetical protein
LDNIVREEANVTELQLTVVPAAASTFADARADGGRIVPGSSNRQDATL